MLDQSYCRNINFQSKIAVLRNLLILDKKYLPQSVCLLEGEGGWNAIWPNSVWTRSNLTWGFPYCQSIFSSIPYLYLWIYSSINISFHGYFLPSIFLFVDIFIIHKYVHANLWMHSILYPSPTGQFTCNDGECINIEQRLRFYTFDV